MHVVTWNLASRVRRLSEQATLLLALAADVICLQELAPSTLSAWSERLQAAGYHTLAASDSRERSLPLRVLTAAREPLHEIPVPGVPWPERVLAACLQDGSEIVNVHSPTSPKPEFDRGEAWDRAELALIQGVHVYGFHDAYRQLHGYQQRELSWEWPRWGADTGSTICSYPGRGRPRAAVTCIHCAGGAIRSLPAARRAPASRRAHSRIVSHGAKRAKPPVPTQRQCSYTRSEPTTQGRQDG